MRAALNPDLIFIVVPSTGVESKTEKFNTTLADDLNLKRAIERV